jgi:hypothetical protein
MAEPARVRARGERVSQLLLHLIGDYITQSHWMATNKTKNSFAALYHALYHALLYGMPFYLLGGHNAVLVIWSTHFFIDRFRLARYVVFAKNFLGWPWAKWSDCAATGYPSEVPAWMAVWLMIVADNTLHLAINYAALRWLR